MNNISGFKTNCSSPSFLGTVDSSVDKYVKDLKKEAKNRYAESYASSGAQINPKAFEIIDKRCDSALRTLKWKADIMHKDTVIKAEKNPRNDDGALYLCAENKNLLQEWEQKGAVNRFSIYRNNLREVKNNNGLSGYDAYITNFEAYVDSINPERLDKSLVRASIANHWNMSMTKITKSDYAIRHAKATQKVADEIGYQTSFLESFTEHVNSVREQMKPADKKKESSLFGKIKQFLLS